MAAVPETTLDPRYSSADATATTWVEARELLERAELFWITTVRPDGRPHVTPLIAVWLDDALHFCTGEDERKARNLAANPQVVMTTGSNTMDDGLDIVVEGEAVNVRDDQRLLELADAWVEKYGEEWRFDVRDGAFRHLQGDERGKVLVFAVAPRTAFGFGKGATFSQTRWRF
jgi:nitroimidazol reductase NimA-like FMN-containing flavoprotein (pyridoxamine 5'-phosphate oxidase superfamily)